MRDRLNKIFAEYSELIDTYLHPSVREQNKDAIRITIEQILYYYEKKDVETAKKAIHHLHMEIAKLIAEINSKVCQINPDAGRSLVSDFLQYLGEREIKAKYGDAILGEFTEMEEMLKERTKILEEGFRRKDALGVKEEPKKDDIPPIDTPNIDLFKSYFVANKNGWWDSLIIDIKANLKSGKGGYTIVAMARVLYDSGKLHESMKPEKFAPWLRVFCQAWGADKAPTCKAGHTKVKNEIVRINNVFYYLNSPIPK